MEFSRGTKEKAVVVGKSPEMLPSSGTSAEALASVSGCFRSQEELGARGWRTRAERSAGQAPVVYSGGVSRGLDASSDGSPSTSNRNQPF